MPPVFRDIGRQTIFGNPVRAAYGEALMGKTLPKYREYLERRLKEDPAFKAEVLKLRDWLLEDMCPGCKGASCKAGVCHGHDLMKAMVSLDPKHPATPIMQGLLTDLGAAPMGATPSGARVATPTPAGRPTTYTGVGSRETPPNMQEFMNTIGRSLAKRGFRLRTGDAAGADAAFLTGALKGLEGKDTAELVRLIEAYMPYTKSKAKGFASYFRGPRSDQLAALERILVETHPKPQALYGVGRELMARNALQLLGPELNDPSDFLIGMLKPKALRRADWDVGGTGQAFRLAKAREVPVFELGSSRDELIAALGKYAHRSQNGPALEALAKMIERLTGKPVDVPAAVAAYTPRPMLTGEEARRMLGAKRGEVLRNRPLDQ
jgi:hypothetical protein